MMTIRCLSCGTVPVAASGYRYNACITATDSNGNSAIERDRKIAAKAVDPCHIAGADSWLAADDEVSFGDAPLGHEGHADFLIARTLGPDYAEHIVRIHNRMPLYDRFVDAVRDLITNHGHDDAEVQALLDVVRERYADLDRETADQTEGKL